MLLTTLIYSGIALVLLILYLIAVRVPLFGNPLAFLFVVLARPLVKVQSTFEKAASYCDGVVAKTLRYPPGVTNDTWHGVLVISRNIILVVSSIILTADVYQTRERLPLLFGGAGAGDLPGSFAIPSSLLFVCMSALYGSVILECLGLLPYGAGLFPKMTDTVKKWLGILCAVGFVLSLLFAVLFRIISAYYTSVDPSTPAFLAIPTLALVGIIMTGACVLSLWGMCIGIVGLTSLVFWLLYCGCHILASIASFVPHMLDALALHLSQGRMSVYGDFLGHEPYKPPASPFPDNNAALQSGRTSVVALPEHASLVDAEIEVVPIETTELEETKIMNPDKNAFVGFYGMFGSSLFPHVVQAIERLRATDSILASYFLERAHTHVQTRIVGIHDLSHLDAEKNLSMLHGESEDAGNHTLLSDLDYKIAETFRHLLAVPSPFVHFIDCREIVNAIDLFESTKRRLPLISQVVVTSVSERDRENKGVQAGIADLIALHAEGIIDSVIVIDPRSPFAAQYGEETQLRFLAQMILSLIIAHKHDPHNAAFSRVFKHMSSLSPFTTVSFASQVVVVGAKPRRYQWLPLASGSAGTGYYSNILASLREVSDRVLLEEDTRAFPAQVHSDASCLVVYNIPIELRDRRFAELARDTSLYVSSNYPFATSSMIRANGCYYPHQLGGRFLVQASCLYPLQPASFPRLQGGKQVRVTPITPLYPVSTAIEAVNGNVPAQHQTRKPKATKVSSARNKKAAGSTLRVVRKNTKQAK